MVDKSPDAFRTISEVAEDLDLPQHVLRFWETRFPQIKPLKRGGGRRYYRPDDVALITGLKALLYGQGYTIKGVQRILKEQGARAVQAVGRGGVLAGSVSSSPPIARSQIAEAAEAAVTPGVAQPLPSSGPDDDDGGPDTQHGADVETVLRMALGELQAARRDLARALAAPDES